jgi:hypothetical protein
MNIERMDLLLDVLARAPEHEFDMTQWCGTAACAFGHLCRDPRAQKLGLRIHRKKPYYRRQFGFKAAALFLDIPVSMAEYVFSLATNNTSKEDVIRLIEFAKYCKTDVRYSR